MINKFNKPLLFLVLGLIAVFKFTGSRKLTLTFVAGYAGVWFLYPILNPKTETTKKLTPEEEEAAKEAAEEAAKMKALKAAEAERKLAEEEKKKKEKETEAPAAPLISHERKKSVAPPPATVPLDPKTKTKIWNMVMQELIDTEKYYIEMLGKIRSIYIEPLKKSKIIPEDKIKEIFGFVEIIESYNNEAILKEFEKWGQKGVTVGQIFNNFTCNVNNNNININDINNINKNNFHKYHLYFCVFVCVCVYLCVFMCI